MATIAAIQMTSGHVVADNLEAAGALLRKAKELGAEIACLPENFAFMGLADADKLAAAESAGDGPAQSFLAATARSLGMWILGGTLPLRGPDTKHVYNASLLFDEAGKRVARYDKIHLFDVSVPDRDENYRESAYVTPGTEAVVIDTPAGKLGMSVCYDLRFPELYRHLVEQGAEWLAVPAAFTVPTGQAHWESLLRARAIENLCYVVAPAQWGRHPSGRETYGHSMIIDYWGRVSAEMSAGAGVIVAQFDPSSLRATRDKFPALANRRFGIGRKRRAVA